MRRVTFTFIFSERAAWGGGGSCQTFPFFFFFSCSADHERDWPPCKECEKQQQTTTTTTVGFLTEHLNTSRPSEHPGGLMGCKDKRAPMVATLGQQYHVGTCFSVVQFIFLRPSQSSAVTPSVQDTINWRLRRQSVHLSVEILL